MSSERGEKGTGPRLRFRPAMRVRSGKDFQRAYREGSRARGSQLLVVACPNGLAHSRLGLSVGKRIWKQAVRRNRIRRIFREAFRLAYPELPQGYDFVLIPAAPRLVARLDLAQRELSNLGPKAVRRVERKRSEAADGEPQR